MVALPFSSFLLSPGDEVVKHALQEFLTLFIFCTFAFKKKCMRSLHAYTPVSGSFTSEPLDQSVNGRSIRSFKKKEGRRVRYNLQTN